jgi:type VI secretion system secreted protein Hcp
MAIFLKLAGVPGSSTDDKFKDQIELQSFQWGAGLGVGSARGGDRTTSEPSVSEISGTKALDKASELLFKNLLMGAIIPTGVISFVAAVKGESVAYATLDLTDVIISGYSQSSGGDFPSEQISLNFGKFDWSFTGRDDKQVGAATHLIYNLATNLVG